MTALADPINTGVGFGRGGGFSLKGAAPADVEAGGKSFLEGVSDVAPAADLIFPGVGTAVSMGIDASMAAFDIYNTIISRREARESKRKAEQRYLNALEREKQRYEDQVSQWQKSFNLTRQQAIANIKLNRDQFNKNVETEQYNRAQNLADRLIQTMNDPNGKGNFMQLMGGAR
jgi:hypothetical protein